MAKESMKDFHKRMTRELNAKREQKRMEQGMQNEDFDFETGLPKKKKHHPSFQEWQSGM